MVTLSLTEENYIKSIYQLQHHKVEDEVSVNEIAASMNTRPATVTDMLRKLSDKELIHYEKYKKICLSDTGNATALQILRKHRLWETFLHEKLNFSWDEVHEVAEQMEHIQSVKLVERLDEFLGFPTYDPHGDPIPDQDGKIPDSKALLLKEGDKDKPYKIVGVRDSSTAFLQQLERFSLNIGSIITIKEKLPFDNSLVLHVNDAPLMISEKIAENILVVL